MTAGIVINLDRYDMEFEANFFTIFCTVFTIKTEVITLV